MSEHAKAVVVVNAAGQPVEGATVKLNANDACGPRWGRTNADGYVLFAFPDSVLDSDVSVWADGYTDYVESLTGPRQLSQIEQTILIGATSENPQDVRLPPLRSLRPVPTPRGPLPPFPPGSYDRTLPWTLPTGPAVLRADAWGVTLPGAPWVLGGSSEHPERILSWFLDRFPEEWQAKILWQHGLNGYTHFILSAPDSIQGNEQSLDQFVALCRSVKAVLPYVTVFLGSKLYQPRDQTAAQWIAYVDPIMDALIAAQAVDEFVPAWEWNLFNVPGQTTLDVFRHVGQKAHAAQTSCWLHFSPEVTSWFVNGDPRGRYGFWADLGADVDGLLYQTHPEWSIGETQARLVDTLTQFGQQGLGHKLRFYEDQAELMFSHDRPNEDDANLRGYLACCTNGVSRVYGYGNGARCPNGDPL
jgi:hypothetical protein